MNDETQGTTGEAPETPEAPAEGEKKARARRTLAQRIADETERVNFYTEKRNNAIARRKSLLGEQRFKANEALREVEEVEKAEAVA